MNRILKSTPAWLAASPRFPGGVESLIEHPAIMTHASVPAVNRKRLGISDGLIRLSVGVEDALDLRDELNRALA